MADDFALEQFIYRLKIKNISKCAVNISDFVLSPWILAESLENTKWQCKFHPYFSSPFTVFGCLFLRAKKDEGPVKITVGGDFGIVDANGVFRKSSEFFRTVSVKRGEGFGRIWLLCSSKLFENRDLYLPNDILTIQCRIKSHRPIKIIITECSVVTDIILEKCLLQWNIRNFDLHYSSNKLYVSLPLTRKLWAGFYLSELSSDEGSVNIVIRNQSIRKIFVTLEASLLNINGANIEFEKVKGILSHHNVLKSKLLMSKKKLLEERTLYENEGFLTLRCEVTIADGRKETHVESTYSTDISAELVSIETTNDSDRRTDLCEVMELKKECASVLKTKISDGNVCQDFPFSAVLGDKDLNAKVEHFISTYPEAFLADEWKDFVKNFPSLASEIILSITKKIV